MSVNPIFDVDEKVEKRVYYELYKELEDSNYRPQTTNRRLAFESHEKPSGILGRLKSWVTFSYKTQSENLHNSMRVAVISGQCVGLFPIAGVFEKDVTNVRFKVLSVRFILSIMMWLAQTFVMVLNIYRLMRNSINVSRLGYFAFYATTWLTSTAFLRLAFVSPYLLKHVVTAGLNEYIDPYVQIRCIITTIALFSIGITEHILSLIALVTRIISCSSSSDDIFKICAEKAFPWFFEIGVPYHGFLTISLVVMNFACAIIWNYPHLFIVCISIYLTSILTQINKILILHDGNHMPSSFWKKLREDYSRATQLIRSFDDILNNIVFVSFASNLFFVCLRLYHILSDGIGFQSDSNSQCQDYRSGPFHGYEQVVYSCFSLIFVITRSLVVCLVVAQIHSASLKVAPILYNVPSTCYCLEVQRFIEQVHGDTVALSGMNFFYVTNEMVLTVAGTIVTYELVLLQLN